MKILVKMLVVVFVLGALAYFGSRIPEKWYTAEQARQAEGERAWEREKAQRTLFPGKIARIDELIRKEDYATADAELAELQKTATGSLGSVVSYRRAEIQYDLCEKHIINFDYFASLKKAKDAGMERDKAANACDKAEKFLAEVGGPDAEFYKRYAEGNTAVRKAITAASQEAQLEALRTAIRSYKKALDVKDDYQTKVNLELLFSLQKNAENAAKGNGSGKDKKPLDPDQFQLKPRNPGPGAGDGSNGKSRL